LLGVRPSSEVNVMRNDQIFLLSALTAALIGCSSEIAPSGEDVGQVSQADLTDNGLHVNGLHVNGLHVNGLHVNGLHVNGTTMNGLHVNGTKLEGTVFSGTVDGNPVSGPAFSGAVMTATMEGTQGTLQVRIDGIDATDDPDINLYGVSVRPPGAVAWQPLCTDPNGDPVQAIPLHGYWDESQGTPTGGDHIDDPNQVTFACLGYALSKCVEIGYKPWKTVVQCAVPGVCRTVPLSYHHQACTRMLRADYCGDGMPSTRDGTVIDVADNVGLESAEAPASWLFEAEWGSEGAVCVKNTRWPTMPQGYGDYPNENVRQYIKTHCPSKWANNPTTCGTPLSSFYPIPGFNVPLKARSLLTTRINPLNSQPTP
jgi:hypothetical protein